MKVWFSGVVLMVLLCATNMVNYIDRGIIPGAADKFDAFIEESKGSKGVNAYFGALQSAFIVGFSVGSIVVGHLVHTQPPFRLSAYGLVAWCASAVAAGCAKVAGSYELLLLGRMASGLGEAGFVTVGGPYIQDVAGAKQGTWLGAFYCAIPLGTAIGYGYGALIAETWNWSWCFFIEAIVMLPLAWSFFVSKDDGSLSFHQDKKKRRRRVAAEDDDDDDESDNKDAESDDTDIIGSFDSDDDDLDVEGPRRRTAESDDDEGRHHLGISSASSSTSKKKKKKNFKVGEFALGVREELILCLGQPTFGWVALGYAGYAGALLGFSTFAPSIVVGLGLWSSMPAASIAFSGTIAASGIIGTPLGGSALDAWTRTRSSTGNREIPALELSLLFNGVGALLVVGAALAKTQALFLGMLFVGTVPLFAATSPMNVALYSSVPHANRAFGSALGVMIMHAFGDVPTPIIVGALKDALAPACTLGRHEDKVADECIHQRFRLRLIAIGCAAWLVFSLLGFGIALARCPSSAVSTKIYDVDNPLLVDEDDDNSSYRPPSPSVVLDDEVKNDNPETSDTVRL